MRTFIDFVCDNCKKIFQKELRQTYKKNRKHHFCSKDCSIKHKTKKVKLPCGNCDEIIERSFAEFKNSKSGNIFCDKSCAATYNNKHKKYGIRRSKLEKHLEKQLKEKYSNLEIHFNRKDAIESELDFYFPSLKLAIELNGLVHYEPIFGQETFTRIVDNDKQKLLACSQNGIELIIVPNLKTCTKKYREEVWNEVEKIILSKLQ